MDESETMGGEPGSELPPDALEVLQRGPTVVKCTGRASLIYANAEQPPSP